MLIALLVVALLAVVFCVPAIRLNILTKPILAQFRRVLPAMSETERSALEAGTVGWDAELFSGKPNWAVLEKAAVPTLTAEEQAFMANQVETLCAMSDDWTQSHYEHDLPPAVWHYMKSQGFLGLIIPKSYGGLGFSAFAHSEVMTKLSTRCSATSVSVMVPNSLGPAELLLHYGTEAQKNYYLPRLAKGEDVPCFALTNPNAGSDAASIPDNGVVCWGEHQGQRVLGVRANFDKRYITLAPVASLIGLALNVRDPEQLLAGSKPGITCFMLPRNHEGLVIGRRHAPLNAVFMNGPLSGKDVFIPLDYIIGGPAQVGHGWQMLMECLAAGRGISLPSSATGMSKLSVRAVGAYSRVRQQFNMPIGRFEGIVEALARMGGNLYRMDALRRYTAGRIDAGEKPAVLSAIAKLHNTEGARRVVNDGMDILGGKGICLGDSNFLGRAYQQLPVAITVEGANILTRSLIVFGQGAIRCHPAIFKEMEAARTGDLKAFDQAFWLHQRHIVRNMVMSVIGGLFGGGSAKARVNRYSTAFAALADMTMLSLGGSLKRRESISARLGDILSHLVLITVSLKRHQDNGAPAADLPLLNWVVADSSHQIEQAFKGVLANLPNRFLATVMKAVLFPLGFNATVANDKTSQAIADILIDANPARDRLTEGMFIGNDKSEVVNQLERALDAVIAVEPINQAIKQGKKSGNTYTPSAAEQAQLDALEALVQQVIRVDDFPLDFGMQAVQEPLKKAA
jgi:acyl-CoA dehydrogenase